MALIDRVKTVLDRLAPQGWQALFALHGLDITATDLKAELGRLLTTIDRSIPGFADFALEGDRGIVPGQPARSLLFHGLASSNVLRESKNGPELRSFATLAELETVENYVFGAQPPSLLDLRSRFPGENIAIVVYAVEYRPGAETVQRRHADFCFSRTGVARVGTSPAVYLPKNRGFLPFVENQKSGLRVLPARYAAYIAIQRKGNRSVFGPMRFQPDDSTLDFWVPIHKLFNGSECLRGLDLQVNLTTNHVNEKLRRSHLEWGRTGIDSGWREPDISQSPFIFREGIAAWATDTQNLGSGLLVPTVHPALVEAATYQNKPLTYKVSPDSPTLSSSLLIPSQNDLRLAPEYVHARHLVRQNGVEENLNDRQDVEATVSKGGYRARHYLDFTGDGWINAECPQLATEINRRVPAYSLVTAPDFFPNADQRELLEWVETSVPAALRENIWRVPPETLADGRFPPNLQLVGANFRAEDKTVTTLVSLPQIGVVQSTRLDPSTTLRHAYLPDAAASVFQPGWDVSLSTTRATPPTPHLAAYGLGSPFPEDAKLCAALSTFWPGVAPDAARNFEPNPDPGSAWPTVSPLTDEEIGQTGTLPWDGIPGPKIITVNNQRLLEYADFDHADYVESALQNKFSVTLTGKVDLPQYKFRVLATARVYRVLGLKTFRQKAAWGVVSFRQVLGADSELRQAQTQSGTVLQGEIFRFHLYRHGISTRNPTNSRLRRVAILEESVLFVDTMKILVKRGTGNWEARNG